MSFRTEFDIPMLEEIEKKVKLPASQSLALTAREIYKMILFLWPFATFWSMANHRVGFGSSDVPLDPPIRPDELGALFDEATMNAEEMLELLKGVIYTQRIFLANAVPYAADVGFSSRNGTRIYAEATNDGVAKATRLLADGKLTGDI
jgi:hypothetical protein